MGLGALWLTPGTGASGGVGGARNTGLSPGDKGRVFARRNKRAVSVFDDAMKGKIVDKHNELRSQEPAPNMEFMVSILGSNCSVCLFTLNE